MGIVDRSGEVRSAMAQAVERALEAAGIQAESLAKRELQNDPVRIDTGLLRNSITHAVSGKAPAISSYSGDHASRYDPESPTPTGNYTGNAPNDTKKRVYVGTNVEYAPYVHEGTDRMRPNRFLKNAIQNNQRELKEIMEKELKKKTRS